jgi:hypothetical protein
MGWHFRVVMTCKYKNIIIVLKIDVYMMSRLNLENAVVPFYVEEMLREIRCYSFATMHDQSSAQIDLNDAIHYYYYPVANILLRKFENCDEFIPFYKMNEIVANYLLHIFKHNHPDLAYHNAIWQACISRQYHTTVYC